MKKVFHIVTHFDLGGAERVALNISKSQNPDFEYHIFEVIRGNSNFSLDYIQEMRDCGIKYHRSFVTNKKIGIVLFPLVFLFQVIIKRPYIVHTHTEIPDLSIFIYHKLAYFFRIKHKYLRTIHNNHLWNGWKSIGKTVEIFFQNENANVAISRNVKDNYTKAYKEGKIPIIFNGANLTSQIRFSHLRDGKINILFAGRLEQQKGINTLINVINGISNDNRFFFHIIGEGSEGSKLKNLPKSLDNVALYPKIYNLAKYLDSFDFLFMPSEFEGLAILPIEASLNGLIPIINSCQGLEDVLPNNWPFKVEDNNVDDYLNIFRNKIFLFEKKYLRKEAHDFALKNFSIMHMQKSYEALYTDAK